MDFEDFGDDYDRHPDGGSSNIEVIGTVEPMEDYSQGLDDILGVLDDMQAGGDPRTAEAVYQELSARCGFDNDVDGGVDTVFFTSALNGMILAGEIAAEQTEDGVVLSVGADADKPITRLLSAAYVTGNGRPRVSFCLRPADDTTEYGTASDRRDEIFVREQSDALLRSLFSAGDCGDEDDARAFDYGAYDPDEAY